MYELIQLELEEGISFRAVYKNSKVFQREQKRLKADITIINASWAEWYSVFSATKTRFFVVQHYPSQGLNHRFVRAVLIRIFLIRAARFVTVSSHFSVSGVPKGSVHCIPNPVVSSLLKLENSSRLKTENIARIAFVGRMINPPKRPEYLVQLSKKTGIPAVFIGDGPQKRLIEQMLRLESVKAELLGFVTDPWAHLKLNDLIVVPSEWEGDGLVVLEAINRGFPVLLSDIPDFRKFGLPEKNYCKDLESFAQRVIEYGSKISQLVAPSKIREDLILERDPLRIADLWTELFDKSFLNQRQLRKWASR